jgi:hypothetical protein
MKSEIQKRLSSKSWDQQIANLVLQKIENQKKLQYTLLALVFSVCLISISFVKSNLDSYELETFYYEFLEETPVEEITSLLQ